MKAERLYKSVADELLKVIESGAYAPGDRLPSERELAATYNVSRPTMREAVIALEIAGRVDVRKGSGVYVLDAPQSEPTSLDLDVGPFELTEARMIIEGEAAALAATTLTEAEMDALGEIIARMEAQADDRLACEAADKDFHMKIAQATRNSALENIIEDLWTQRDKSELAKTMYQTVHMEGVMPNITEHIAIFEALKKRDGNAARLAMRTHLSRVIETMFRATEIEAVAQVKRRMSKDRQRLKQLMKSGG